MKGVQFQAGHERMAGVEAKKKKKSGAQVGGYRKTRQENEGGSGVLVWVLLVKEGREADEFMNMARIEVWSMVMGT